MLCTFLKNRTFRSWRGVQHYGHVVKHGVESGVKYRGKEIRCSLASFLQYEIRVVQSLVVWVVFCRSLFILFSLSFVHSIVCPWIYGFSATPLILCCIQVDIFTVVYIYYNFLKYESGIQLFKILCNIMLIVCQWVQGLHIIMVAGFITTCVISAYHH
jgi:hypothetical protein